MSRPFLRYSLLLLAALLVLSTAHRVRAADNEDYALKISLEDQIEKKLKQVIVEITGTDRVVLFVNAELVSKGSAGDRSKTEKSSSALVLPGVPAKKEFGAQQSAIPLHGAAGRFSVSKIVLSIWIDESVPSSIVDLIQDIAKNVVGFSQTRGDQINIKRVGFESKRIAWSSFFMPPNVFWLILTLVGGFALYSIGMFFTEPLRKVIPALREIDWGRIRGTGRGSSPMERAATYERDVLAERTDGAKIASGDGDEALPFGFVRERDIPGLAFLLRDRGPQDAAIVANYLDPALAMNLLDRLPAEKQVEVALILGREEINAEKVNALEDLIRSKLAYVVGGENKLIPLLDMANEDTRERIVSSLSARDAQAATRLKQRIKSLETLLREMPAAGIQTLSRNIDAPLFARVLKSLPDELQQKVVSSLSDGVAERLKEEMQLSRALSGARLRKERQDLVVLIRRLISEGIVEVENS